MYKLNCSNYNCNITHNRNLSITHSIPMCKVYREHCIQCCPGTVYSLMMSYSKAMNTLMSLIIILIIK